MDLLLEHLEKYKHTVILSVVAVIVLIIGIVFCNGQKHVLSGVKAETVQTQSKMAVIEQQLHKEDTKTDIVSSGLNQDRLTADYKIMNNLFSTIFTFRNAEEYSQIRTQMVVDRVVREGGEFLKFFYPETFEGDTSAWSRYSHQLMDGGNYTLSYQSFVPYLVGIDNGTYAYVNDVTVESNGKSYRVVVQCIVNDSGEITLQTGYVLQPEK